MSRRTKRIAAGLLAGMLVAGVMAAEPDHPIITEVYTDPVGANDGPVGRDPASPHQEFIEIYLPTAAALRPGLNKDALNLTFYEVEGDTSSSGYRLVNYRFDLPTFDLDPSNGTTPGAIPRPASGVVVLGWVDYVGDPPVDLAGTPSSRVALINGGITSASGFVFIAINGHHFTGTTNFPTLVAESLIDVPNETRSGIVQNGSGAYLLVNRDDPGYVELFDDKHVPPGRSADPDLAGGTVLGVSALLDGYAPNDDRQFDVTQQPYPFGGGIDLDEVLPAGGPFSRLICQLPEIDNTPPDAGRANGYARRFVDLPRTTENANPFDDDPVADALNVYRQIRNDGPFFPTPGRVVFLTDPPELSVAAAGGQVVSVLAGTTARTPVLAANVGGDYPIDITATPGASSDPTVATFAAGSAATAVPGQALGVPTLSVHVPVDAPNNATATSTVTVTAANSNPGDPAVVHAVQTTDVTVRAFNPLFGEDVNGQPFQTTVTIAFQPVVSDPLVNNELLGMSFGQFLAANLGTLAQDVQGFGPALVDPNTNLADPTVVWPMVKEFPSNFANYVNPPGPPGHFDLVQTILNSAEYLDGTGTYDNVFNPSMTAVRAIRMNIPDTLTFGGTFTPAEPIVLADPAGRIINDPFSPMYLPTTDRTFEVALIDTNVRISGTIETGATDDFGIVVEVLDVEPGSPMVPGEFVFLSYFGGLQGADIDSLQLPANGTPLANIILLDLDNLHDMLGIRSIEALWLIDAGGESDEANFIEAFSLNPVAGTPPCPGDLNGDGTINLADLSTLLGNFGIPSGATPEMGDLDGDGDVDLSDLSGLLSVFGTSCP